MPKWKPRSGAISTLARAVAAAAAATGARKAAPSTARKTKTITRKRTASQTTTRRGRETLTPTAEYTRQSVSMGKKKPKTLAQVSKFVKSNISQRVLSHRNYSQFGGSGGALALLNTSTTSTTGSLSLPLHLWELNASPNVVNGVATNPTIMWTPQFSDPTSTGTLSWNKPAITLALENADAPTNAYDNYPMGGDVMDWFKAKMIFYCPTTLPCRYQIDVVQIKDTRLVPDTANTGAFAAAFYQAMSKRFAYSPLEEGDSRYQKYLKVLYTTTFILNPKESTEAVNTIYREVNIFMRTNRRCTYDWEDQDQMAMLSQEGQTNTDTNLKTSVHPRARIFLMIRAQSKNGTAYSPTIHPSYDIVLKTAHSQLSS